MKISQDTVPLSTGHYWVNDAKTGVWRTARKNMLCKGGSRRTEHYIMAGDRYLDTGERSGVWATYKCCEECADQRATSIYGEQQGAPTPNAKETEHGN